MEDKKKVREFLERWCESADLMERLLEVAIQQGVPFKHPDTGKWHDRSGLGFDSFEELTKYGDAFVFPDDQRQFKLR